MEPVTTSPSGSISTTGTSWACVSAKRWGVTLLHSLYRSGIFGPVWYWVAAGTVRTVPSVAVIIPTALIRWLVTFARHVKRLSMTVVASPWVIILLAGGCGCGSDPAPAGVASWA